MSKEGNKTGPGRPPGALNKRTREMLDSIMRVMGVLEETLESDIREMKPAERAKLWHDLQEYATPKLARTEIINNEPRKIIIEIDRGENKDTPALPPPETEGDITDGEEV